jgi:hypothetical protein
MSKDIEDVFGIEVTHGLEEHWQPMDVIVLLKCMNTENGNIVYCFRTSSGISVAEQAGLLYLTLEDVQKEWRHES